MSSGGRLMYIHSVGVPPVVLIHGINGTNASWGPINESNLKTLLEEEEGRTVKYFSYPSSNIFNWNMSISDLAHRLDDSLAAWNDSLNIEQNGVDLIAHSMGGLIARYYISHPNEFTFSNKVNKLVTLGTPNYGAALASWGAVVPFATQAVEMEYGSNFTWNLHQAWIAAQPQTQVMTIVGSLNYDVPHDGIVRIPSANLANFGYGNSYVPNSHGGTDGMAYITNTSHPSYQAISAFLSGQPVISNIENVNQFDDGILILGLFNEAGSSVRVATFPPFFGFPQVFWEPDPSLYNFGSGVNFSSGKYWATGANAGSYQLTVVPVGGYSTTVLEDVEILAHLTTLISRTVSPAPGSSSNSFAGGDSPPFVFGSTSVTLDFASGPPCSVSVYRFDENPPNCSAATLPHYWQIESDSLEAPISAQVTIAYDPAETDAEGMQESDMDIAYFDGSWHPLSTNLDLANHTASTTTDVFTLFAIGHFVPLSFNLSQNYPNPFNGVTVIPYELPETALVSLKIYNVRGQVVKILRDQSQAAGSYRAYWDGRDEQGLVASSGVYFYHLEAGGFAQVRKMLLIK